MKDIYALPNGVLLRVKMTWVKYVINKGSPPGGSTAGRYCSDPSPHPVGRGILWRAASSVSSIEGVMQKLFKNPDACAALWRAYSLSMQGGAARAARV